MAMAADTTDASCNNPILMINDAEISQITLDAEEARRRRKKRRKKIQQAHDISHLAANLDLHRPSIIGNMVTLLLHAFSNTLPRYSIEYSLETLY